ncbi:hypothetical protein C7S18_06065 [Ahniella affigens]|uniref:Uncharacterized protein n=1 Tax=Ahniella affigens TaxID=2021234 RepID=A0A2P1PPL7_9GAMM|nr:hypothetical protein C7S18_06065 [Ahniella affigens]
MKGLTREDSSTIGFVGACYLSNAVDTPELNEWAERIMIVGSGYPDYVVDLREFEAPRFHFYRVVGFTADRSLSDTESHAIYGIAYLRGREVVDCPSREVATAALSSCPHILEEFRATFPFLYSPRQG